MSTFDTIRHNHIDRPDRSGPALFVGAALRVGAPTDAGPMP
jgi:hypothetical protein